MYRHGWHTWEQDLARGGDRFLLRGFLSDVKSFSLNREASCRYSLGWIVSSLVSVSEVPQGHCFRVVARMAGDHLWSLDALVSLSGPLRILHGCLEGIPCEAHWLS